MTAQTYKCMACGNIGPAMEKYTTDNQYPPSVDKCCAECGYNGLVRFFMDPKSHKYWDIALNIIAGVLLIASIVILAYLFIEYTLPMMGYV